MIKLMHLYQNSDIGGVQVQLLNLFKHYDRGLILPYFTSIRHSGPLAREMRNLNVQTISLEKSNYNDLFGITLNLRKILMEKGIELLHTHRFISNFFGRLATIYLKIPTIISIHDNYNKDKRLHRRIINRLLLFNTSAIAAVSQSIKKDIIKYDRLDDKKIYVIRNGVDLSVFNPEVQSNFLRKEFGLTENEIILGFIGRLVEAKSVDLLLNAFSKVCKKRRDIRLLIVGYGNLFNRLYALTNELGITDKVIFTGTRRDIPMILSIIDIFVLPSKYEGLPNVLLEAMAMKKPVIACKIGGIPEIITHAENGYLINNDLNELTSAIELLIDDVNLRNKIAINARKYVENELDIKKITKTWENLYLTILNKSKGS